MPCRGRIQKIPPCRDRKHLQSSVPRHLVGSANCHWVLPQKLLRRLRYGAIHFITQTPRDDLVDCPHPRRHCLGMESAATETPPTHENMTYEETCKTIPRPTLWRLAPTSPPPSFDRKPALPTGAMAHTIATQQRLSRFGRRRPRM